MGTDGDPDQTWRETAEERDLAASVADRLRRRIPAETDCTFFDGLVSHVETLVALGAPGADAAIARLGALATPGSSHEPSVACVILGVKHPAPSEGP